MQLNLTWDNNPDMLASEDVLLYRSGYVPEVGDTLTLSGFTVEVISVEHIFEPHNKHNWRVGINGMDVPAIKELLTYRVDNASQ